MDTGDERRLKYSLDQLKRLASKATNVVNWYPHFDSVRGPFGRGFTCSQAQDHHTKYVSSTYDDCAYAAAAMNSLPHLIEEIESLREQLKVASIVSKLGD